MKITPVLVLLFLGNIVTDVAALGETLNPGPLTHYCWIVRNRIVKACASRFTWDRQVNVSFVVNSTGQIVEAKSKGDAESEKAEAIIKGLRTVPAPSSNLDSPLHLLVNTSRNPDNVDVYVEGLNYDSYVQQVQRDMEFKFDYNVFNHFRSDDSTGSGQSSISTLHIPEQKLDSEGGCALCIKNGQAAMNAKNYSLAIQLFERALVFDSKSDSAKHELSNAYNALAAYDLKANSAKAMENFKKAKEYWPENPMTPETLEQAQKLYDQSQRGRNQQILFEKNEYTGISGKP